MQDESLDDFLVDSARPISLEKISVQNLPTSFNIPSAKELLNLGQQPKSGGELSNGSGSGEPFLGYLVQRMPVGLARELVSSSGGSDNNSGGLAALVSSLGINSASLGSKDSAEPQGIQKLNEATGPSQLDMSLNNLFDSLKMKNGPLIHHNRFDLTQKLNEELLLKSIWAGANSSGGNTDNGESVPPPEGSVEFGDLVQ